MIKTHVTGKISKVGIVNMTPAPDCHGLAANVDTHQRCKDPD